MRTIKAREIEEVVAELAIKANISLRRDVLTAFEKALRHESGRKAKNILKILLENAKLAKEQRLPICQDTGMAVVFCEIGQDVRVEGDINSAIDNGIKSGYKKGLLRKSVVSDPLIRKNTGTNTPPIIHYDMIRGDRVRLTVLPKGFGSENASRLKMLSPADTEEEILKFIVDTVKEVGRSACPPLVLGIGIGGTMDMAALLAKKAILRPIGRSSNDKHLALFEKRILREVNKTGIGPGGLGGKTTCLGVSILSFPTHIAGMPVCINISCHALRSASRAI